MLTTMSITTIERTRYIDATSIDCVNPISAVQTAILQQSPLVDCYVLMAVLPAPRGDSHNQQTPFQKVEDLWDVQSFPHAEFVTASIGSKCQLG